MARSDDLRKEVGAQLDPPSLAYFARAREMADWVDGDQAKRDRLEKRWRRAYDTHRRKARLKAQAGAEKADR